jgi:oligoribonuclease (3'-5' exoribonuclease)
MKFPEVKIIVECNWESVTHKIKWEASLNRYKDIFKSILRFNWYKEDIIKKELW